MTQIVSKLLKNFYKNVKHIFLIFSQKEDSLSSFFRTHFRAFIIMLCLLRIWWQSIVIRFFSSVAYRHIDTLKTNTQGTPNWIFLLKSQLCFWSLYFIFFDSNVVQVKRPLQRLIVEPSDKICNLLNIFCNEKKVTLYKNNI